MEKGIKRESFNLANLNRLVEVKLRLKKLAIVNKKKVNSEEFEYLTQRCSLTETKLSIDKSVNHKDNRFKHYIKRTFAGPNRPI